MESDANSMSFMLIGMIVIFVLLSYAIFFNSKKTETPVVTNTVTGVDKSLYSVFLNYFPTASMFINTIIYYNNSIYGDTGSTYYS
jgi:hypothetical protein